MMHNEAFMNEKMDYKLLYIRLKKCLLRIILFTLAGALLGGVIYLLVQSAKMGTIYQSFSQFRIQYAYDPSGQAEQFYNAYTWNDLLHADPVMDRMFAAMQGRADYKEIMVPYDDAAIKELLRGETIRAYVPSDRRIVNVEVQAENPEQCALIQESMEQALIDYVATDPALSGAELIRSDAPVLLVWNNNLWRAVIFGAVLALLLALFAWWFYYILDDSLYTIACAEKRYPYPVAGISIKGESHFDTALQKNLSYLSRNHPAANQLSLEDIASKDTQSLRQNGAILLLPFGRRNGKQIDRVISFLKTQDIPIICLIITAADGKFVREYYRNDKPE